MHNERTQFLGFPNLENPQKNSEWTYPKEAALQLNNPAVTNSTPYAEINIEREKKPSSKRIEYKRNWDVGIPQLNHLAYISIYIDVRRRRKTERLPLEAKTKAETIEQEDETVSEIVE